MEHRDGLWLGAAFGRFAGLAAAVVDPLVHVLHAPVGAVVLEPLFEPRRAPDRDVSVFDELAEPEGGVLDDEVIPVFLYGADLQDAASGDRRDRPRSKKRRVAGLTLHPDAGPVVGDEDGVPGGGVETSHVAAEIDVPFGLERRAGHLVHIAVAARTAER